MSAKAEPAASHGDTRFLPALELPKGGLALHGLGERWSVNTQNGSLSVTVPIPASPGRGASTADLALNFTNNGGRSPFGLGWGLSVPSVTRRTHKLLPRYDSSDVYGLSGFDDLVPQRESDGVGGWPLVEHAETINGVAHTVRRFRPRTDDTRTRIEQCLPAGGAVPFWRTTDAGNVTRYFGRTPSSRISDPADPTGSRVFEWLLDEVCDDRGNVAVYDYKQENTANVVAQPGEAHRLAPGATPQGNRYLKSIRYANAVPDDASTTRLLILLDYGEHELTPDETHQWAARQDAYSTYSAGFEIRTWRRCRRLLVFHDFGDDLGPGPTPRLVRAVELTHEPSLSRLTALQHIGYRWNGTGYDQTALPPLEFGYADPHIDTAIRDLAITSITDGAHIGFVDLDSDGLPGVLTTTPGGWWYQRPAGEGQYEPPRPVSELPPTGSDGTAGMRDVDGTGRIGIAAESQGLAGTSIRQPDGSWDRYLPYDTRAVADLSDPRLQRVDLTGDGRADLVANSAEEIRWTPSLGRSGYGRTARIPTAGSPAEGPCPPGANGAHEWFTADMSGDGLADLVRVHAGRVDYWPNLGWGRYGARVTMTGTLSLDSPFDGNRIRLADIDGSGTADLLYLGDRAVTLWRNNCGTSWAAPEPLMPLPPVTDLDELQVLDILGTGTPALVWTTSKPGGPAARYLDLAVAGRPNHLTSLTNNLGAHTTFFYDTTAGQQLAARRAGRPWQTTTAGATPVVAKVQADDLVSHTSHVTRYTYRDAYFDPYERESRGFGYAETCDAETIGDGGGAFDLPPVRTCEWFYSGRPADAPSGIFVGDPHAITLDALRRNGISGGLEYAQSARAVAGHRIRTETYVDDGISTTPVVVSQSRPCVRQLQPHHEHWAAVFRVEPLEALTAHYEQTADDPRVTHDLTLGTDDHGTPNSTVSVAYPRRKPQIEEQNRVLMTWTQTDLASLDAVDVYRVSHPTASREYEITGLPVPPARCYSVDPLAAQLATLLERDYADPITPGLAQRRLRAATRTEYWDATLGAALPVGQIGVRALPRRVLRFTMTPTFVSNVFPSLATPATLTGEAGYELSDGLWWASDGIRGYETAAFYLPAWHTTPFGNTATVSYDAHRLLPTAAKASTTAPLSLNTTQAANDYTALAPHQLTDANGVVHRVAFDPLGRVSRSWRQAPDGSGDTNALPGAIFTYGTNDWHSSLTPCWSHTAVRINHADPNSAWREQRMFIDGSGRTAMIKIAVEPGEAWADDGAGGVITVDTSPQPRWVATGRTVFDNKGHPIEQYEPYFATDTAFDVAEALVKHALLQRRTYDALGRVIRVDHPDGTLETITYGPWEQINADRNDTVLASTWYTERQPGGAAPADQQRAATLAAAHANTPQVQQCDPLGRFVRVRDDNGAGGLYETRYLRDLAGDITEVHDARGVCVNTALRDAAGRVVRTESIDAGTEVVLSDAAGRQIRLLAAAGHIVSTRYDLLGRLTQRAVREPGAAGDRLAELTVHGEVHPQAADRMLIGQPHRRYDQSGYARYDRYDLNGNLVETTRQLLAGSGAPDWTATAAVPLSGLDAAAAALLDPETFVSTDTFDAVGQPVRHALPDGTHIMLGYTAGGLNTVDAHHAGAAEPSAVVNGIAYDARRQRTTINHANGAVITHLFDPDTGRPTGIHTRAGAAVLQHLDYTYDPAGNIVAIRDGAQQSIFFAGAVVAPGALFTYDPLYRLNTASGREHASLGVQPDAANPAMPTLPHPNDANALRAYTQTYTYDPVGNITAVAHASTTNSWKRRYQYTPGTNRLAAHQIPGDADPGPYSAHFAYDPAGNTTSSPGMAALTWTDSNRVATIDLGGGGTITYHYDAAGNRLRKIWQRLGPLREERIYLGELELFRRYRSGILTFERRTVRISDGQRTAALVETVTVDTENPGFDTAPRTRFQLTDLIGSSAAECDETATVISYEEYHPFGTTALWLARDAAAVSTRRYRYLSKERDSATGLYAAGARDYMCWLGRWLSPDPAGLIDGTNRYSYCGNNPTSRCDPSGLAGKQPIPGMIGNDPKVGKLWEQAVVETLGPRFGAKTYQEAMDGFQAELNKRIAAKGLGSNKQAGTGINYARETYGAVRTRFGKLAAKAGIDLAGVQIHHTFEELAQSPEAALKTSNLSFQRGNAGTPGTGHNFAHAVNDAARAGVKNPGQHVAADMRGRGIEPDVPELQKTGGAAKAPEIAKTTAPQRPPGTPAAQPAPAAGPKPAAVPTPAEAPPPKPPLASGPPKPTAAAPAAAAPPPPKPALTSAPPAPPTGPKAPPKPPAAAPAAPIGPAKPPAAAPAAAAPPPPKPQQASGPPRPSVGPAPAKPTLRGATFGAASMALSGYGFYENVSQGNVAGASADGASFASTGLVLGGGAVGSAGLVTAGTVLAIPATAYGLTQGAVAAGSPEAAASAGQSYDQLMGNRGPSVGGAIVAGGTAIVEAPYFVVKGAAQGIAGGIETAGNWLGDSVYRWTH